MVSVRPADISLSQLHGRVAARGGNTSEVETQELNDATPQVDTGAADADSDGIVSDQELTTFIQGQNAPVVFQYTDEAGQVHTYQVTVNAEGRAQIGEVVEEETDAAVSEEDLAPGAGASASPAVTEVEDQQRLELLRQLIANLRTARQRLREKIEEIIAENAREMEEAEEVAARRAAQEKLEETYAAIVRLEARINALTNVSPRQRALILDKLQALAEAAHTLENLSAGLADGTATPEQIDEQNRVIEGLTAEIEEKLDEEEIRILTAVFGNNLEEIFEDPAAVLDDGKIDPSELREGYRGYVGRRVVGELASEGVSFGELEALRDKGQQIVGEKLARLLGMDPGSDAFDRVYDELREAAERGKLNCARWNDIMRAHGLIDAYRMTDECFAALFLGREDNVITDETVSGTLNLDRAIRRIHQTMAGMGGAEGVSAVFRTYAQGENFFFVDFERQAGVVREALRGLFIHIQDTDIAGLSDRELMDILLNPNENFPIPDGLRAILDELWGRDRYLGQVIDREGDRLSGESRGFREASAGEQFEMLTARVVGRLFAAIEAQGNSQQEILQAKMRIYERILTAIQEIPAEELAAAFSDPNRATGETLVLQAYAAELQQVIFIGARSNLDHKAILEGRPHLLEGPVIPAAEGAVTTAEPRPVEEVA